MAIVGITKIQCELMAPVWCALRPHDDAILSFFHYMSIEIGIGLFAGRQAASPLGSVMAPSTVNLVPGSF